MQLKILPQERRMGKPVYNLKIKEQNSVSSMWKPYWYMHILKTKAPKKTGVSLTTLESWLPKCMVNE